MGTKRQGVYDRTHTNRCQTAGNALTNVVPPSSAASSTRVGTSYSLRRLCLPTANSFPNFIVFIMIFFFHASRSSFRKVYRRNLIVYTQMIYQALSPTFFAYLYLLTENKWTSSTGGTAEIIIKLLFSRGYTRVITNAVSEEEGRRYRTNFPKAYSSAKNPQVLNTQKSNRTCIYTYTCVCERKREN